MSNFPVLHVLFFSVAMWFGLYLLARNLRKAGVRFAGLGLVAYALWLGGDMLSSDANWRIPVALIAGLCWVGAVWYLLPSETRQNLPKRPVYFILLATVSFTIGLILVFFPPAWLSDDVLLLALGFDFVLLGYAIVVLDAYDEGEAFLPDVLRSMGVSLFTALVFGLQIVMIASVSGALTTTTILLLLGSITTAIVIQVFSDLIQSGVDSIVLAPRLRQARADLRAAASAVSRIDDSVNVSTLDDAEFTRLTRRALSNMGDLQRLAASPLTQLPAIESRLAQKGIRDNTLERANELKLLLTESIIRLKPRDKGDFGTSDEWRYYNALYFPYVVGLRPYSRRDSLNGFDATTQAALDWFGVQVPERTLHSWQNAAAKLVAQDLRDL